ncbi:MAG TPA: aminotransferase class I/II-fold pyridoxal phosphate-dependent enzyme, partial [Actinomycetota bacterium]|nr:aminotransferase class I/II-fold pyridoxal phosphate-dependent enzyme [Actinomycetota bacterium]
MARIAGSRMRIARRIESLPPYLFAALDDRLAAKRAEGVDIISLGVGDPDMPTPEHVVEAMREAVRDPSTHRYPSYWGSLEFREAVVGWYARRFDVDLDPRTEVLALIGSKEGLGHLPMAFVDPGDETMVPDPGYPVYGVATRLAGGTPVALPLIPENGYQPDFDGAPVSERTKMLWLNYPSNPTAAVADRGTFERAVAFARDHDLLVAHDAAYSEITFDGYVAPSILQVPGGKDVALEFGSASKFFNMTGWRIGWCAGSAEAIRALSVVKTNLDSGQFTAIQRAAIAALTGPQDHLDELRAVYQRRRDVVVGTLNNLGWSLKPPLGSIYVWAPTPEGRTS